MWKQNTATSRVEVLSFLTHPPHNTELPSIKKRKTRVLRHTISIATKPSKPASTSSFFKKPTSRMTNHQQSKSKSKNLGCYNLYPRNIDQDQQRQKAFPLPPLPYSSKASPSFSHMRETSSQEQRNQRLLSIIDTALHIIDDRAVPSKSQSIPKKQ